MSIIDGTIQLLLAPPGGLVYHLLILFSLEAILGIALGTWQRRRAGGPEKISNVFVVAAVGMLLARVILVAAALADASGMLSAERIIPPLERAVDTAITLLLVWTLVPWGRYRDLSWFFPGFGLLGTAIVFVLLLFRWQANLADDPSLFYSGALQEVAWILAQLALLGFGTLVVLWRRSREWGLFLAVLILLAAGQILQLAAPYPNIHAAGWVRLAQLIAFPLLAVAVYRRVIGDLSFWAHEMEEVSQDSLSQIAGLIYLIESGQRTVASLDMTEVLERAVREVVRILKVDTCGLVFPFDVQRGRANVSAVYSPHSQGITNVVRFKSADHPALEHAVKRKKQVTIDTADDSTQVKELYVLMGSMKTGPLLIQPLLYNNKAIGALLLGNNHSGQRFTASQQKLCQALSRQVAIAIENARHYETIVEEVEALKVQREEEQAERRQAQINLEAQLQQAQADAARFASQLDEATAHIKRKQENVESLAKQFQEVEKERVQLEAELDGARQELRSLEQRLQEQTAQTHGTRAALETQLAQARDQIAQMTRRLKERQGPPSPANAILDAASIGLLVTDENGLVNLANVTAGQLLIQPVEQMLGRPIDEICDDAHWQAKIARFLDRQADASQTEKHDSFTIDREGHSVAVKLRLLHDDESQSSALIAALSTPTADKEANQARDEFLGALAQELRTPMTSITGYTDLLLGESVGIVSEMQRKFLQRIKANIERMGAMLNDLIGVTAIDSGQLHLEPEPIEVGNAIQEALVGARAQLEEKDLTLNLELSPNMETIEADPNAFRQIMSNLISNACKASPVGGEIGIVATYENEKPDLDQSRLLVAVTDSGSGILPEDQPRVFDRFYRAEQVLIAGLGETGVGLSIVKALIEAHHGQIWVESEMGQGSTFAFALPTTLSEDNSSSSPGGK